MWIGLMWSTGMTDALAQGREDGDDKYGDITYAEFHRALDGLDELPYARDPMFQIDIGMATIKDDTGFQWGLIYCAGPIEAGSTRKEQLFISDTGADTIGASFRYTIIIEDPDDTDAVNALNAHDGDWLNQPYREMMHISTEGPYNGLDPGLAMQEPTEVTRYEFELNQPHSAVPVGALLREHHHKVGEPEHIVDHWVYYGGPSGFRPLKFLGDTVEVDLIGPAGSTLSFLSAQSGNQPYLGYAKPDYTISEMTGSKSGL